MSWDIYGNKLRPGNCEVHPEISEEYPCWRCRQERKQHEGKDNDQLADRISHLERRIEELERKGGAE